MKTLQRFVAASALALGLLILLALAAAAQDAPVGGAVPDQPAQVSAQGAAQLAALQIEKEARVPLEEKLSSQLLLALRRWHNDPLLQTLPALQTLAPDAAGRVLVDIALVDETGLKPVVQFLAQNGAEIAYQSAPQRAVRARLLLDQVTALAALPPVRSVRPADEAVTNTSFAATTVWGPTSAWSASPNRIDTAEGDVTHQADLARQLYGVTGAGQKICVLSDGINSLAAAQASGDLPPSVDVLPDQTGFGDEGTAMLEIVYDLAPSAQLGFATGFGGSAAFADNIRALHASGCTIIVDDISYLLESPFQDGEIAQAVIDVTEAGAMYFSSAANIGNLDSGAAGAWEGDFQANGALAGLPGGTVHNFGDGGQSNVLTEAATTVLLHWAEPQGASGSDYDLYIMDAALTNVLAASTDRQTGSGVAVESVSGNFPAGARVVVWRKNGAGNRMISVLAWRSRLQLATAGSTRGHSAAPLAFSVAAVPAAAAFGPGQPAGPYPFPFTAADVVEWFSADGPRRIFFDHAGSWLPGAPVGNYSASGGVVRQKPDITAADGVSTATPGFKPFFGTSASAPHAAALVGLLQEAFPLSSTLEIRNLLQVTALDIMVPGVDRNSGYGIIMPIPALAQGGVQSRAMLIAAPPHLVEVYGNGDSVVDPLETWQLSLPLTNTGQTDAVAISAVLASSTPGVTVPAAAASYPNLPAGAAGANVTPFIFQAGAAVNCGTTLAFTLTLDYTDTAARTRSLPLSLPTGTISAAPLTFAYSGPVVAIPDKTTPTITATAALTVAGVSGRVGRLQFRIDGAQCTTNPGATTVGVDHTYVSDLRLSLRSPDGMQVTLLANVGEGGRNFCQTVLDDSAAVSILGIAGTYAPFSGTYRPAEPLAAFAAHAPNGTWQLLAADEGLNDTGHLRAFSLQLWPVACAPMPNIPVLSGLALGAGELSPVFNPAQTTYTAQLNAAAQTITLTPFTNWSGGKLYVDGREAAPGSPLDVALASGAHTEIVIELRDSASAVVNSYRVVANRAPQLPASAWGTAQAMPLTFPALGRAADPDGDPVTLAAATVLTASAGAASYAPGGSITYTPTAGASGLAVVNLLARDTHGGLAAAAAYIVVGETNEGAPQALAYDARQTVTATLTGANAATLTLALGSGAYTGTLGTQDSFYVALAHVTTPAGGLATPPPGFSTTGQLFTLAGYRNAAALAQLRLGSPLTVTLHYAGAPAIGGLLPATLTLYAWDAATGRWSQDGLARLAHDETNGVITYTLDHLAPFGFFGQTAAPQWLYLPNVRRQ